MPTPALLGDAHSHGGQLTGASPTVRVGGVGVARVGDPAFCPLPGHGLVFVSQGSSSVRAEGRPVARKGDRLSCGAVITGLPGTVRVGG